jgi:hypothetical protein
LQRTKRRKKDLVSLLLITLGFIKFAPNIPCWIKIDFENCYLNSFPFWTCFDPRRYQDDNGEDDGDGGEGNEVDGDDKVDGGELKPRRVLNPYPS